ncbi:hypothetical protein ACFX14_041185 [Malus domestica]
MGRGTEDLIPTDLTVSSFSSAITKTHGILPLEVDLGSKKIMLSFFVVDCTSTYGALFGRDWIHQSLAIPSTLHQQMVEAESRPFLPTTNVAEASFYNPNVGILKCSGADENGRPTRMSEIDLVSSQIPYTSMTEQKKRDQVMAVRSLIKRLLVYRKGRRQERELLDREEQEWQVGTSTSQHESKEESCREELDRAIQMAECIYDLDGPDDLPEIPELVEFLCTEPDKPPPEVQDPLEVINLGTEEDPIPIQISGLLGLMIGQGLFVFCKNSKTVLLGIIPRCQG